MAKKEKSPEQVSREKKALNKLTNELLQAQTGYDLEGWKGFINLTRKALTTKPANMATHTKELERVLKELEELAQPVNNNTWDEVVDAWMQMYDSYENLEGARARIMLEQVFADDLIRKNVGAAHQLHDIAHANQPPDGLLVLLKAAKAQLKKNMNNYVKAANKEMAKIQRIKDHQIKLVGWLSLFFLTVGTSVGSIFSHWVNDKYILGHGESPDPQPVGNLTRGLHAGISHGHVTPERRLGVVPSVEVSSFPCLAMLFLVVALVVRSAWCSAKTRMPKARFTGHGALTFWVVSMVLLVLAVLMLGFVPETSQPADVFALTHGSGPRRLRGTVVDQLKRDVEVTELEHKLQRQRDAMMLEHSFATTVEQLTHELKFSELERLLELKRELAKTDYAPVFSDETEET
jgi:hypothetical protein